ncbi:MAG: hypothetical protein SGILL_002871 [Bacillariaceae sp.]
MTERNVIGDLAARHAILCRQFFGRGPYYVKFTLNLPEGESSFVVEIATRKELPLSVFSLLTLVESNFYGGLSLSNGGNGLLQIGANRNMDDSERHKLKSLGFSGESTLYFDEQSEGHPCQAGSMSFDERGPGLAVHTVDHNLQYGSCFGTIVRGKDDIVPLIQVSLERGESLKLLSADILLAGDTSEER